MEKTIKDLDIYISDGNYSSKYPRSEEFVEEGIPFIRGNNMVDGDISDDEMYYITPEKHAILLKGHVKAGDVLITTRGNIGQVAIVPERHEDSNINAQIVLLRTNPESLYNRYLLWALQSHRANEQYIALQTGTALKQLPVGKLEKLSIKVADIDEQQDIANTLDKVYEVIKERRKELLLLDDLIRARFVEMFGNPIYNSNDLPIKSLNDLGEWSSGGTPSRTIPKYFEGDINWYSAGELNTLFLDGSVEKITEEAIEKSAAKLFKAGSMLVGMYDTAAFKMGILKENSASNQACACITPNDEVNIIWLYYELQLMKEHFLSQRRGVRQKNLNLGMIKGFEVPIANREQQDMFVDFVKQVDKSKVAVQKALDETQLLFDSLMQKYFG